MQSFYSQGSVCDPFCKILMCFPAGSWNPCNLSAKCRYMKEVKQPASRNLQVPEFVGFGLVDTRGLHNSQRIS